MALAKLTGELDESARVNVLIQQQAAADEQLTMLERLMIEELIELRRLIAKAQAVEIDVIDLPRTAANPPQGQNSSMDSGT